jgi:predicted alternative tryptophan synthase beta-subunit
VLNHVLLHQTVIGQEAQAAMARLGVYPDVVIGCVGGGSNLHRGSTHAGHNLMRLRA